MSEARGKADLRVVRGEPTDAEVAALVAALSALSASPGGAPQSPALSRWADRATLLRTAQRHGPDAWRASARLP